MLCGVSVVGPDESAELLFAADCSMALRSKGSAQDLVVHAHTTMRALGVVMIDPGVGDVIYADNANV